MIKEGIYKNISNADYHSEPALSSGGIKLLSRSAAHYKYPEKKPATDALNFGKATHSFILQPELNEVITSPKGLDLRKTNDRKVYAQFQIENKDKIIVDEDSYKTLSNMRDAISKHDTARMLLEKGIAEQSVFWKHPIKDFMCKCRPDFAVDDLLMIVDYKTARDASARPFRYDLYKYGYHIQSKWYSTGMSIATLENWDFIFIVQEKTPPYAIAVYMLKHKHLVNAQKEIDKAVELYDQGLNNNIWQGYPDMIQTI